MKFLILFPIFIALSGCIPGTPGPFKFKIKEATQGVTLNQVDLNEIKATYSNLVKHIFKAKCIGCHGIKKAKLGVNLEIYEEVFGYSDYFFPIVTKNDPDNSGVYTETARGAMPPKNPLSQEEVDFIKRWIENGAPEN
ncbi:MAG: hypothetical protein NXH75_09585 [Halobacteriovoraceae bacterium]|nr:hypothetical protein [Halobacteriovoraceae bacterium]